MKLIHIPFTTLLLTGCVIGDPDPFHKGDIKITDNKICIYAKDVTPDDKYVAYGISQYPDWRESENLENISPVNAYRNCLPSYEYKPEVKYSVVYVVNTGTKEKILYDVMFMLHIKNGITSVERLD